MAIVTFIKCCLRLPLEFLYFTVDYLRLIAHLIAKKFSSSRSCTFCFDSSNTVQFPRPAKAAAKYSNLWMFKFICPSMARSTDTKESEPATCCHAKSARMKFRWFRHSLSGLALLLVWCSLAWVGLVESGLLSALRPVPDPLHTGAGANRSHARSFIKRVLPTSKNPEKAQEFLEKARKAFASGDYESAKLAYLNAKKFDPDNTEIRLGLANCYYRLNKREAALMEFNNSAQMDPNAEGVHEKLAELYASGGNVKKVLEHGQKALEKEPQNPDIQLLLAECYLVQNQPEKARQEIEAALQSTGDDADYMNKAARLYQMLKDDAQAEALYRSALELDAENVDSLVGLTALLERTKRAKEAADLLAKSSVLAPDDIRVAVQRAERALSEKKLDQAIAMYRDIAERFPKAFPEKARLAQILLRSGRFEEGLKMAERLSVSGDPSSEAIGSFILADYYVIVRLHDKALSHLKKVTRFNPKHLGARILTANALMVKKEYERCIAELEIIISLDPDNVEAAVALGRVYFFMGREEEAVSALKEAREKHPESALPYLTLAKYYYFKQNYTLVLEQLEKAYTRAPENPNVLNQLAMCLLMLNQDVDRAVELAKRLTEKFPGNPYYVDTYGWGLYHQGEYAEALRLISFAHTAKPRNPEISYHLGMVHYKLKNVDRARSYLDHAFGLAEEFVGADEAREALAALPEADKAAL